MPPKYVNAIGGNNGNSGSSHSDAWATCTYGLLQCEAGDVLYLDGTFTENFGTSLTPFPSGTAGNPITITSYDPDNHAIIKAPGNGSALYLKDFPYYLSFINLEFDANGSLNAPVCDGSGAYLIYQDCEMHGGDGTGASAGSGMLCTGYFCQFINCNMHHNGSDYGGPNPHGHGIYLTYLNNIIDGGTYHHNARYGIHMFDSGQTDWNNNIVRNVQSYLNENGILITSGHNLKAYGNLAYNNSSNGISIGESAVASNAECLNNTVFGNGGYGILVGSGGGSGSVNAIIRNNISFSNGTNYSDTGTGTTEDHNLFTDPDFVDSGDPPDGFKIQSTSDARGAGVDVGILRDYSGVLYADPPSIGAFEYAGDVPPPAGDPPIETFNYSNGSINGLNTGTNWTIAWDDQGTTATVIAATPTGGAGVKVAKLSPTSTNTCKIERFFGAVDTGIFYVTLQATTNDSASFRTFLLMQGGTPSPDDGVLVRLGPSGLVQAYDFLTTTWETIGSYSANTWVLVGIELDASGHADQFRAQVNGGAFSSWLNGNAPMPSVNVIHGFSNDTTADFYIGSIGVNQNVTHDYYYAATASGDGNGTTAANALAYNDATYGLDTAFAQTAGNTLHICGTITGGNGFTLCTLTHSGGVGDPIIIKFETGAIVEAPYFNSNSAIHGTADWITVDGGTNGIMRCTANGKELANQAQSGCINIVGSHIEIVNLTMTGMYVQTEPADGHSLSGAIGLQGSNLEVHYCTMAEGYIGIDVPFNSGDHHLHFHHNSFNHFNWDIHIGNGGTAAASSIVIHDNHHQDFDNWDNVAGDYHHNGVFIVTQNTASDIANTKIYNELFDGNVGDKMTACVFTNTGIHGLYVFNCIFAPTGGTGAFMCEGGITGDSNTVFVNNTVNAFGQSALGLSYIDGVLVENNAIANCYTFYYIGGGGGSPVAGTQLSDYNAFPSADVASNGNAFAWNYGTNLYSQYKAAQQPSFDHHSITPDSFNLDSNYSPLPESPLIAAGTNLSSALASAIPEIMFDYYGNSRPASDPWTIGAVEVNTTPPPTPTVMTIKRIRLLI